MRCERSSSWQTKCPVSTTVIIVLRKGASPCLHHVLVWVGNLWLMLERRQKALKLISVAGLCTPSIVACTEAYRRALNPHPSSLRILKLSSTWQSPSFNHVTRCFFFFKKSELFHFHLMKAFGSFDYWTHFHVFHTATQNLWKTVSEKEKESPNGLGNAVGGGRAAASTTSFFPAQKLHWGVLFFCSTCTDIQHGLAESVK